MVPLVLVPVALTCTDTVVPMDPPGSWVFSARILDDTKLYMATLEVNARGSTFTARAPSGAHAGSHGASASARCLRPSTPSSMCTASV